MTTAPDIDDLRVINWRRESAVDGPGVLRGLILDTCLRRLLVQRGDIARYCGAEHYEGIDAYRYLLEVTTGLRSKVPGETNVFGQFKSAVVSFENSGRHTDVAELRPVLRRVIDDTRRIRREQLRGIGGASYGRLVRRLIRPAPGERILFVGAGNLAESMLPFFRQFTVGLWNRSASPLTKKVALAFSYEQLEQAAAWAHHAILTTPPDADNDELWRQALDGRKLCTTVHLGHRRDQHPPWVVARRHFNLDHVFELRAKLADCRSLQIERARVACHDAALTLDANSGADFPAQAARA